MAYGTIKVDNITFTNAGSDQGTTVSGLYRAITSGVAVSGTISGATIQGVTVSGTTVTGSIANFVSGVFTTSISGVTVTGTTASFTSGVFTSLSGTTTTVTSGIFGAGSATAPSVAINNGTTYAPGIYSPGTDVLAVSTSGTERLRIDSSGRVGIGTTGPQSQLQVLDQIKVSNSTQSQGSVVLGDGASTAFNVGIARWNGTTNAAGAGGIGYFSQGTGNVGGHYFYTGDAAAGLQTVRLVVNPSGNVGIGTSSPNKLLHVAGTEAVVGAYQLELEGRFIGYGAGIQFSSRTSSGGTLLAMAKITADGESSWDTTPANQDAGLRFYTTLDGTLAEKLRIDASGRVGIGTTSPTSPLTFAGAVGRKIDLYQGTEAYSIGVETSEFRFLTDVGASITFKRGGTYASSTESARIDSSGRLLVGTSSARSNLYNASYTPSVQFETVGSNLTSRGLSLAYNNSTDTGGPILHFITSRGGTAGSNTIVASGDELGVINFTGADGTRPIQGASINSYVDGTPGNLSMPGRLVFSTTASGSASPTERMRIDSSGRVGIGTTSPSSTLHVAGTGRFVSTQSLYLDGASGNYSAWYYNGTSVGYIGTANPAMVGGGNTDFAITTASATNLTFGIASFEKARIDSSGRLLVGTSSSSSSAKCVIQGYVGQPNFEGIIQLGFGTSSPANGDALGVLAITDSSSNRGATIVGLRDGGTWTSGSSHPTRLVFSTTADGASNPTERMRIDSSGSVTVGATGGTNVLIIPGSDVPRCEFYNSGTQTMAFGYRGPSAPGTTNTGELRVVANSPLVFSTNNTARMTIGNGGAVSVSNTAAEGTEIFGVYRSGTYSIASFLVTSGGANTSSLPAIIVGRNSATTRSINAGGTINASGADYAEYMFKAGNFTIAKGDICAVTIDGELTNIFADAVSFLVKSTNPSYVGGDTWGTEDIIGSKPDAKDLDALAQWQAKAETERQKVDRIAFAGQVPVNVTGATPGQYIVPLATEDGGITGIAKDEADLTLAEYMRAVGKVIAIENDGRARIIVKVA